jgi:hypothetical protein
MAETPLKTSRQEIEPMDTPQYFDNELNHRGIGPSDLE